jgi:hypothetical protein
VSDDFKPVTETHVWRDLWWTCVVNLTSPGWMDFQLYRIESFEGLDEEKDPPGYWIKGATSNSVTTPDLDKAQESMEGYVKFDGCSQWNMGHEHLCGRHMLKQQSEAMSRVYDLAAKLMEHWEGD